jgi:diguanylate cyclase (GGDEF)-like protein
VVSTLDNTSRSRPLDPEGLAPRIAPFAGALLVGFAFVNLRHDGGSPNRVIVAAAVAAMLVLAVGAVPWRRLPRWAQTLPPLAFFVLVALLIDVDGGSSSAFSPLALLPVLWLALYGTRGQLLAGILGAVAVFLVPIVWLGAPRYPPDQWQTPTMWMITAALVGTVVHELVREMRTRAARVEMASSSDELTSLPSRAAWNERLPQELTRARREGWQVSVVLFVLEGLDEVRAGQGDAAADALLRETAFSWAQQLRGTDLLVRYSDGSFAAAFPGCSLGSAMQLADRMRTLVEAIAVSVGVACWDGDEGPDGLMGRVASAAQEARESGSDFVVPAATT